MYLFDVGCSFLCSICRSSLHQVRKSQCENNTKKKFSTDLQYNVYRGQRRIYIPCTQNTMLKHGSDELMIEHPIVWLCPQEKYPGNVNPKKGQQSLLNTAMKLLTKIITQHISSTVSMSKKNKALETIDQQPKRLTLLKNVLKILQEQWANKNILQVIKQLKTNNSTRIQSGISITEKVQVSDKEIAWVQYSSSWW